MSTSARASQAPAQPISVLMYHQIGCFDNPQTHRALYCDIDRFRSQLGYLKWAGFSVLSLAQAYACLFGQAPLPRRAVVITVDDGYQNFADYAWPALQEYGYPATVFLVSSLLGQPSKWLPDYAAHPKLMDAATIRRLQQEGVHFGSHAQTHPRLTSLAPAAMRQEVWDSKQALQDILGQRVEDFCYPYGDYNEAVRQTVQDAGYRSGLTCIRGAANFAANAFEIPRKAISYGDNLIGYGWKVHFKHALKS